MSIVKLTGNKRFRFRGQTRFLRKSLLVLQVATERKRGAYCDHRGDTCAPPNWDADEVIVTWKDATIEETIQYLLEEEEDA
jgi:hypothetical protein